MTNLTHRLTRTVFFASLVIGLCFLATAVLADDDPCFVRLYPNMTGLYPNMPKDKIAEIAPICPVTNVTNDIVQCTRCHSLDRWKLKEVYPNDILRHPEWITYENMKSIGESFQNIEGLGQKRGYYLLKNVSADEIKGFLDYMKFHNISHITIEIQSYGGGLANSWRIIGLLQEWEKHGGIVETQINGVAFSAGFLIFISGTKGHRFVSPTAELMWHELQVWKQTGIETPSSTKDQADIYRHLQDTANDWIISRSNITKEELDKKVMNREFWLNGADAVEFGFADGFI